MKTGARKRGGTKLNYNTYFIERMALEIRDDRMRDAARHNRWVQARKALRDLARSCQ